MSPQPPQSGLLLRRVHVKVTGAFVVPSVPTIRISQQHWTRPISPSQPSTVIAWPTALS